MRGVWSPALCSHRIDRSSGWVHYLFRGPVPEDAADGLVVVRPVQRHRHTHRVLLVWGPPPVGPFAGLGLLAVVRTAGRDVRNGDSHDRIV